MNFLWIYISFTKCFIERGLGFMTLFEDAISKRRLCVYVVFYIFTSQATQSYLVLLSIMFVVCSG